MQHHTAFAREGTFAGWPANNGVWAWNGDEILTGCSTGKLVVQPGHNIGAEVDSLLLRSRNGGETWEAERPANFVGDRGELSVLEQALDFSAPGFALRMIASGYHGCDEKRGGFYASSDRGKIWAGPFFFSGLQDAPELRGLELTSRTDYLILGLAECLVFLSARDAEKWGSDRVFCARTRDGGCHFEFISWITPWQDPSRGVMPSTVSCGGGKLFSAVRRRSMNADENQCWIDGYESLDQGASWAFLSRVGETGIENGNPPALARLRDGRLCCVYGCRSRRQMLARFSSTEGRQWDSEIVLRDDFSALDKDADFGYPRLVQRSDGRLVAMYYWATRAIPQQHIAVTIF